MVMPRTKKPSPLGQAGWALPLVLVAASFAVFADSRGRETVEIERQFARDARSVALNLVEDVELDIHRIELQARQIDWSRVSDPAGRAAALSDEDHGIHTAWIARDGRAWRLESYVAGRKQPSRALVFPPALERELAGARAARRSFFDRPPEGAPELWGSALWLFVPAFAPDGRLLGYAAAFLDLDPFLHYCVLALPPRGIDYLVEDADLRGAPLARHLARGTTRAGALDRWLLSARLRETMPITVHGDGLVVLAEGTPAYEASQRTGEPWLLLAFCLSFTLAASVYLRRRHAHDELLAVAEHELGRVVDATGAMIVSVDVEGRVKFVNARALAAFGLKEHEMVGRPLAYFTDAIGRVELEFRLSRRREGSVETYEMRFLRRDGSTFWVLVAAAPNVDERGLLAGSTGIMTDISDRKAAEEREREWMERVKSLQAALDEHALVTITDAAGVITYANDKFCAVSGYSRAELLGREHRVVNSGRHSTEFWATFWETITGGAVWKGEILNRAKDGRTFWVDATVVPFLRPDGKPYQYVAIRTDITRRKQEIAERERLAQIVESSRDLIAMADPSTQRITYMNRAGREMCGFGADEDISSLTVQHLHPPHATQWIEGSIRETLKTGSSKGETFFLDVRTGEEIPVALHGILHKAADGTSLLLSCVARDLRSERRAAAERADLEDQFRQSQKMEAIGRLAGGVAHDFNNILTAIKAYAEFLAQALKDQPEPLADVKGVIAGAERAAALTQQLLAFSRKQALTLVALDVNDGIRNLGKLLRRVLGENIKVELRLAESLWPVKADQTQLDQMVLNLAVNSRDAMAGGGTLAIESSNLVVSGASPARSGVAPGDYVALSIVDDGAGIAPEVLPHVFEPFFTTKEKGKGTGLGLSMVYGTVKQLGGHVYVFSRLGSGTRIELLLPRCARTGAAGDSTDDASAPACGRGETVLFVEDDDAVRTLTLRGLRKHGFRIVAASSGEQALKLFEAAEGKIDLLVTDVIMPGMNGPALAKTLRGRRPRLNVLFVSGYTDDALGANGVLDAGVDLMQKPFSADQLAARMRRNLDEKARYSGGAHGEDTGG